MPPPLEVRALKFTHVFASEHLAIGFRSITYVPLQQIFVMNHKWAGQLWFKILPLFLSRIMPLGLLKNINFSSSPWANLSKFIYMVGNHKMQTFLIWFFFLGKLWFQTFFSTGVMPPDLQENLNFSGFLFSK